MSAASRLAPPRRPQSCLSDFALDRWSVGELAGEPWVAAKAHLDSCPGCRARADELAHPAAPPIDLDALLARRKQPATAPNRQRPRADPARPLWWRRFALPAASALALGAVLLAVWPGLPPGERTKGSGWSLTVIARHPSGMVERVAPNAALSPGDQLRFEVRGDGREAYVAIISLDASGAVSALVPSQGRTVRVGGDRKQLLHGAVKLDEVLGRERIVHLACASPLAVTDVVDAARRALARAHGDLAEVGDLGLGCWQGSFWIRKVVRP